MIITTEDLIARHTVYSCVLGSRAFGLGTDDGDAGVRGVYAAPAELFWGFAKPPVHIEGPAADQFSWELERFCVLALRSNPTALECLHSPVVEYADDVGRELLDLRGAFLSRQTHRTFLRFAERRRAEVETDVRHGAPRWKRIMHLVRILIMCRDLPRTGELTLDVRDEREGLLAIRRGEVPWPDVARRLDRLTAEAEAARPSGVLAAEPDRARVEDFLIRVRRASVTAPAPPAPAVSEALEALEAPAVPETPKAPEAPEATMVAAAPGAGEHADDDVAERVTGAQAEGLADVPSEATSEVTTRDRSEGPGR